MELEDKLINMISNEKIRTHQLETELRVANNVCALLTQRILSEEWSLSIQRKDFLKGRMHVSPGAVEELKKVSFDTIAVLLDRIDEMKRPGTLPGGLSLRVVRESPNAEFLYSATKYAWSTQCEWRFILITANDIKSWEGGGPSFKDILDTWTTLQYTIAESDIAISCYFLSTDKGESHTYTWNNPDAE